MTASSYENAAALLRRQQRTTARLKVGLPALLAHLEHTELLPADATDPDDPGTEAGDAAPPPPD